MMVANCPSTSRLSPGRRVSADRQRRRSGDVGVLRPDRLDGPADHGVMMIIEVRS